MAYILHIDSSPRVERSLSRMLTNQFVTDWTVHHPNRGVVRRDLAKEPVPYLDDTWVSAKFTPQEQHTPELADAIALSNQLVDEFLSADAYLLSTPMYNLSIPAVLKSYIDYIVRPNRTFAIADGTYQGLVQGKKMLIVTARGSDFRPTSNLAPLDFQEPYLRAIFNFIGITDIQFVNANGLNTGLSERSLAEA